jgi:hypothetical protein
MKDEVKITVIATGFDNHSQVALPSAPSVDTQAVGGQFGARPALKPIEKPREEDINVPTFIRRQAD